MTKTLPTITAKQKEILKLIHTYRFLNTKQIQALLGHKDKRRVISWLKDLREKQYTDWHYDPTDFIAKSKPAIYYISLDGVRYLRQLGLYPSEELRKRYKEPRRTQSFIDRCLLVADCCIALHIKSSDTLRYTCVLPTDYADTSSTYYFLNELKPHLYFSKQQGGETTCYLLEVFEQALPRYQIRKRLKDYGEYLASEREEHHGARSTALLVCASIADLLYVKRLVRKLVEESWSDENLCVRVTTLNKLATSSVGSMIWEEI